MTQLPAEFLVDVKPVLFQQKQDPSICCLQGTHFRVKDTHRLKVRIWKMIFHANRNDNKAGVAILIPDNIDFKTKATVKDKEGH